MEKEYEILKYINLNLNTLIQNQAVIFQKLEAISQRHDKLECADRKNTASPQTQEQETKPD